MPRPTRSLPVRQPPLGEDEVATILNRHARALRGRTTQNEIVAAVRAAAQLLFDDGLKHRQGWKTGGERFLLKPALSG